MEKVSVAIDGPSGAGKSTVAKGIAKRLGFIYIDTGAMYRSIAYKNIIDGNSEFDTQKVINSIEKMEIDIKIIDNDQHIFIDNVDISDKLRTREVALGASAVATIFEVREKLVFIQRKMASYNDVVMDGRDIGTYVLPNAEYKFYLDASVIERAKRRLDEHVSKGEKDIILEDIIKEIEKRDYKDMNRKLNPLKKADDAIIIDSTSLCINEVVINILNNINIH